MSIELFGVFSCPWITVIHTKIVHSVYSEHCFHGICSRTAVQRPIFFLILVPRCGDNNDVESSNREMLDEMLNHEIF
jgi:hypothetical protein